MPPSVRGLRVVLGRLDEPPHHLPVLTGEEAKREAAPLDDQRMRHRRTLDRDGEVLRRHRHLHGPVHGHQVAALPRPAPEQVQARRQLPEHAAPQPVVLLRRRCRREKDRPGWRGCSHSHRSRANGASARSRVSNARCGDAAAGRSVDPVSGQETGRLVEGDNPGRDRRQGRPHPAWTGGCRERHTSCPHSRSARRRRSTRS